MMLLRIAQRMMSASELSSSLRMTAARWVSTVLTLRVRRRAMSLLLSPSARSWMLSRHETVGQHVDRSGRSALQEALEDHLGHTAGEEGLAASKALHSGDKLACGVGLQKVSSGTCREHLADQLLTLVHREHEHLNLRCHLPNAPCCFEPV